MATYLADQFKEIFIKKVMETEFTYYKEDGVSTIIWEIYSEIDEDMDFGVYRHGEDSYSTEEPEVSSFFAYFTDRSIAIMKVYFVPEVSVEVMTFPPVLYKTEAEKFVEEFRNSKEHTPETIDKLLDNNIRKSFRTSALSHLPYPCENDLNWRLDDEMSCEFIMFYDGSIAGFQKMCDKAWVHNYLK